MSRSEILEIHTGDVDKRRPVHPVSRARCAAIALGPAALSLLAFLASAFGGFLERAARAPRQRQRPRQRHSQGPTAPSPSSRHASAHHLVCLQHQFSLCRLSLWSCTTIGLISLGASRHRCSPTSARPLKNAAVKKQLPRQQQRCRDGTDSCASSSLFLFAAFGRGSSAQRAASTDAGKHLAERPENLKRFAPLRRHPQEESSSSRSGTAARRSCAFSSPALAQTQLRRSAGTGCPCWWSVTSVELRCSSA